MPTQSVNPATRTGPTPENWLLRNFFGVPTVFFKDSGR